MASLLYIESSPRKEKSLSIKVAHAFIEEYRKTHPADSVETLDLWKTELPEFTGDVIESKYVILHGERHTPDQLKAWSAIEKIINEFKNADKYLFSLPMWNFGIPYRLKHYIDVLVQPGYAFSYSPAEGYKGLITGRPAALIYARGGAYSEGTVAESYDFQKTYMEQILGFIGFTDIRPLVIEPTLNVTDEEMAKILENAINEARASAATF